MAVCCLLRTARALHTTAAGGGLFFEILQNMCSSALQSATVLLAKCKHSAVDWAEPHMLHCCCCRLVVDEIADGAEEIQVGKRTVNIRQYCSW